MQNSAKHFGLAVGPYARQHEPKWPQNYFIYDVSHKNLHPPTKNFFKCNLLDWPIRLSPWTAF